ncbi:MAG: DUF2273 domain-containing protein [Selenomonadaceae bacterium]
MKEDFKRLSEEVWQEHRGKFLGTMLGIVLGIVVLLFGFWKTIFILFCGLIGLFVGMKIDSSEDFWQKLQSFLPPIFRR